MALTVVEGAPDVFNKLLRSRIALEKVVVRKEQRLGQRVLGIMGTVHVSNLIYQKRIFARVTIDDWGSFQDIHCGYLGSDIDGLSDYFGFGFTRHDDKPIDVEFALCCIQAGLETWDNNNGKNYKFHLSKDPFADS